MYREEVSLHSHPSTYSLLSCSVVHAHTSILMPILTYIYLYVCVYRVYDMRGRAVSEDRYKLKH